MPKRWAKIAISAAAMVGIAVILVVGIFLWGALKYQNADDRADEESAAVAASIAAKIDERGDSIVTAVSTGGGILIRQDDGSTQTRVTVRVRAVDTGFGGGPIRNEHCYEFNVPKASEQKVTYKRVHLDRCVDWVVPRGSPPESDRPRGGG